MTPFEVSVSVATIIEVRPRASVIWKLALTENVQLLRALEQAGAVLRAGHDDGLGVSFLHAELSQGGYAASIVFLLGAVGEPALLEADDDRGQAVATALRRRPRWVALVGAEVRP